MNINTATQHQGIMAWDGTTASQIDIRRHVHFSFTFQTISDLAADAKFKIQAAPASDVDPCVPGTFVDVEEVLTCMPYWGTQPGPITELVIPTGTKAGSICSAALPCKPNAFVQLVATAGAPVRAVAVLSGPM